MTKTAEKPLSGTYLYSPYKGLTPSRDLKPISNSYFDFNTKRKYWRTGDKLELSVLLAQQWAQKNECPKMQVLSICTRTTQSCEGWHGATLNIFV